MRRDHRADNAELTRAEILERLQDDPAIQKMMTGNPAEIQAFINNNITDLASVQALLLRLCLAVRYLHTKT